MLPHPALFFIYLNMFCSTFGRLRKIAKSDYYLFHICPSVRQSTWNNSAPTEGDFREI